MKKLPDNAEVRLTYVPSDLSIFEIETDKPYDTKQPIGYVEYVVHGRIASVRIYLEAML